MKQPLKSFTSFTRTERLGVILLCGMLFIFILIRVTMSRWATPPVDTITQQKLTESWEVFKRSQRPHKDTVLPKQDYLDAADDNSAPMPAIVNINTADSATLVRLKGIGPVTASRIVQRRRTNGPFTDISQLRELGSVSDATFELLKAHLTVGDTK